MFERLNFFLLMQFDEQKDQAVVEKILKVVFLDVNGQSPVSKS